MMLKYVIQVECLEARFYIPWDEVVLIFSWNRIHRRPILSQTWDKECPRYPDRDAETLAKRPYPDTWDGTPSRCPSRRSAGI